MLTGMAMRGVNVLTVNRKKGSVDKKIMDLMDTELHKTRKYTDASVSRTLFVLISGDRDFAHSIKKARQCKIEVVLISSTDCPANHDFLSLLRSPGGACNWLEIVERAQRSGVVLATSPERKPSPSPSPAPSRISAALGSRVTVSNVPIVSLSRA
ncbi:NYN domain-containing protein [archaeon]|nr:MAG: NYN domain-containing protein [archaeon]